MHHECYHPRYIKGLWQGMASRAATWILLLSYLSLDGLFNLSSPSYQEDTWRSLLIASHRKPMRSMPISIRIFSSALPSFSSIITFCLRTPRFLANICANATAHYRCTAQHLDDLAPDLSSVLALVARWLEGLVCKMQYVQNQISNVPPSPIRS